MTAALRESVACALRDHRMERTRYKVTDIPHVIAPTADEWDAADAVIAALRGAGYQVVAPRPCRACGNPTGACDVPGACG